MVNSKEAARKKPEVFPLLSFGELHIWQVSTHPEPELLEQYKNALSEKELAKISFFEFEKVKDSYAIRQGALRILLSAYLDIPPKVLNIGCQKKGKPYSIDDPGLYFNMSNSGKMAVFVFSRDSEVGIDIEHIRSLTDLDEMITRNFTVNEIKFINAKPTDRVSRFFRFWTIKESYLKAIGEGVRLPPENLEFAIENDHIRQVSVKGVFEQEDWNFKEFSPARDYVGTITYAQSKEVRIRLKTLKLKKIHLPGLET